MKIFNLTIAYNFSSSVHLEENPDTSAFFQNYTAHIYDGEVSDPMSKNYVGKVAFKMMNLAKALDQEENIHDVFDTYDTTYRWGQTFYELFEERFNPVLLEAYPELEFWVDSICFIETMALLPAYRGKRIGDQIWKDILWNFSDQCSLFVLHAFPLQFEGSFKEEGNDKMWGLNQLNTDEEKAKDKLKVFYTRLGLREFKEIEDMFFYCPLYK